MSTLEIISIPALLILGFTLLQWLTATVNRVFRVDYGRYNSTGNFRISVIIPARNEEANIGAILGDLAAQSYTNLEIIVVNDESTDRTAEIVQKFPDVILVNAEKKDSEWLGKNYACYLGARRAKGKYLLFLDADVRLGTNAIASTVGYYEQSGVVFLSVFPRQLMNSTGVYRVVPLMNYILLSLLPLPLVRLAPFVSMAAANGQFMLFDHELYTALEPHKRYRSEKVEDIHISRYYKRSGYRIACVTGNSDISCTMYDTYDQAMEGFSKNVFAFFGNSVVAGLLFWVITFSGIVWMLVLPWYAALIYLAALAATRLMISVTSRQSVWTNLRMHYIQLWTLGQLMFKSIHHQRNKNYTWKGRTIY